MISDEFLSHLFSSFIKVMDEINFPIPAVSLIAEENNSPYRILVSTILSLRTKDSVTYESSMRLFSIAPDIYTLSSLCIEEIENAIKPSGFYKRKAIELKEIASIIIDDWGGFIPPDREKLMSLPGVGIKTANLVLNLSFQKEAICVDCHVHQISNRMGWVKTNSPEETEVELERIIPPSFWIEINEILVRWGQSVCLSVSPKCSLCPINKECPKIGVEKHR